MNERIKELAVDAMDVVRSHGAFGEPERHYKLNTEKFAELIVRECIAVSERHAKDLACQPTSRLMQAYDEGIIDGIYEATAAIKEHFGVTE